MLKTNEVVYTYRSKFQTVTAVNGITLEFKPGRFYAIVGKSGCGKTTLLSLLAGLDLPTKGEVLFMDNATSKLNCDDYRRDHAAVIYQSYNLFPLLTVLENVCYPLWLKKLNDKAAQDIAREKLLSVGLTEDQFKRYPNMLSGGEQQRVAIARALVTNAEIILADEPTGNLDSENGKNILEILKALAHEQNRCVIVVTHDPGIAEEADEVIALSDGKVKEPA